MADPMPARVYAQVMTLSDAATVREGLLNVLGAGISRVGRKTYPAQLRAMVASLIGIEGPVPEGGLSIFFRITDGATGEQIAEDMPLGVAKEDVADSGENSPASLPVILDLTEMPLPGPGLFHIGLWVNQEKLASVSFLALETG